MDPAGGYAPGDGSNEESTSTAYEREAGKRAPAAATALRAGLEDKLRRRASIERVLAAR